MMKMITAALLILLPGIVMAQSVTYDCKASKVFKPAINIKHDKVFQIKKLSIPMATELKDYRVDMTYSVITMLDEANSGGRTLKPKDITVSLKAKELKSGTLIELDTTSMDEARLDSLFLELGNIDVVTAGPVPPGKYPVKLALGLVSSQFSMTDPMLFQKVVLNCETEIKY